VLAAGALTASDAAIAVFVAIPVVVVGGGVAVGLRLRGRGPKPAVPPGEVASDATTDIELARGAEATRAAQGSAGDVAVAEPPAVAAETTTALEPEREAEEAPPVSYRSRLGKARGLLAGYLGSVRGRARIDAETWEDLEEALIRADVGVGATDALLADLRQRVKGGEIDGPDALLAALKSDLVSMLSPAGGNVPLGLLGRGGDDGAGGDGAVGDGAGGDGAGHGGDSTGRSPTTPNASAVGDADRPVDVWLFVGVNGVGKTTTVGKMASRLRLGGESVLLAAGDTFRAAASDQLALWASRVDADIVRGSEGGDPSAVIFDAVQRAAAKGDSVVLADTAGRLHNKVNLIEELKKIRRVADRAPGRVVEVLLVLDATTGQNGLAQAKVFLDAVDVSGVVLTKLDGTAKGGIVVAIQRELGLPVKLVGLGEGVGDLVDFDPQAFVDALF
jgi:fused signal recognition particle receptor